MQNLYTKFSFIVAFMVFIVFYNMTFGSKATEYLLIIVLIGMGLTNADTISKMFKKSTTVETGTAKTGVDGFMASKPEQYM